MTRAQAVEVLDNLTKTCDDDNYEAIEMAIDSMCENTDDIKKIKIKYFDDTVKRFNRICIGHWITLYAFDVVMLDAGESGWIPLGVGMILPKGYEAHIIIPKDVFNNFGIWLPSGMEVIEDTGDNQWMLYARALRDIVIPDGEPICKFRIMKTQPVLNFEEVEQLHG